MKPAATKKTIEVMEGNTNKVFETLLSWKNARYKFYVLFGGHFYGFKTKNDADTFIPDFYFGSPALKKRFKECKINKEWVINLIPQSIDDFTILNFCLLEEHNKWNTSLLKQQVSSSSIFFEFCDEDGEPLFFKYCQHHKSLQEGELICFPKDEEENDLEITYRVINVIKKMGGAFTEDIQEGYKIIVRPYIEGKREVLTEKFNRYDNR
jgi:hypothetical protein